MIFSSREFILVFLPVTLAGYFALAQAGRARWARRWLLLASLVFYGWWSWKYLGLLLATVAFNYLAARALAPRAGGRQAPRALLAVPVAANLAVLGFYKYANFVLVTVGASPLQNLVLPLAISFHTFQQIAYLVDAWRGKVGKESLEEYALFVTFFPQLIAGPIVHHAELTPQLRDARTYRFHDDAFAAGVAFFVAGLVKKVLFADQINGLVDPVFDGALRSTPSFADAWVAIVGYSLGLYFDFSGYSDMAVGLARMMGIRLPYNFDSPYRAASIIEFWRRWHMTLSRWLRDYVYFPLGGNRAGPGRRYLNLMITMLLGGLWHGAAWTFVAWGALHGSYLLVAHAWRALRERVARGGVALPSSPRAGWALTLLAVMLAWVLFRAPSFEHAAIVYQSAFGMHGWAPTMPLSLVPAAALAHGTGLELLTPKGLFRLFLELDYRVLALLVGAFVALALPNTQQVIDGAAAGAGAGAGARVPRALRWRPNLRWAAVLAATFVGTLTVMSGAREFVYFQF